MANVKKDETTSKVKKTTKTVESDSTKEKVAKKSTATKKVVKEAQPKTEIKKVVKAKKATNATYATGKRKNAIAKVWLSQGNGTITINGKPADEYLKRAILGVIINQPFQKTDTENKFDINCTVIGGGLSGQAGAIKHAISIALQLLNPELRGALKSAGFLTRDSRVVERKKAGLKKARKGQVYQRR